MDPNIQTQSSQAPQPIDPHYVSSNRKSFKNFFIIIFLAVLFIGLILSLLLFLRARSDQDKNKEIRLTYWGIWDDINIMAPIIADFERENPSVKVVYKMQDIKGLGDYVERLTTRISQGNNEPDIIRFHSSWTRQLKDHLSPFPKSVISAIDLEKDYYKTIERDLRINGAYYGVPLGIDTLALFVNTALLESKGLRVPDDWSDIYSKYAPELVVKDSEGKIISPAISLGTFDNISHASDIVSLLLIQNGADLEDLNGNSKSSAIDALRYYTVFSKGDDAVWDESQDNSTLAFAKGNLPLYFGYSWDIFTIKAINPNIAFQVAKVPSLPGRNDAISSYWAEGVSAKSKNSKEAFKFLEYLSKPQTLQKLHETQARARLFGNLYPRKSMQPLLSSNSLIYPFVQQADNARSTFFSDGTYDGKNGMISQLNVYLGNAVRSINQNTSVDSAVETLANGVKQVVSRYK